MNDYSLVALVLSAVNIWYMIYLLYRIRQQEKETFEIFKDVEILKAITKVTGRKP